MSKYFSKDEILSSLEQIYNCDNSDYFDDLFNDLFNSDYYIYGYCEAATALETYKYNKELDSYKPKMNGVFGAIELVENYEVENFGEPMTSAADPEKIANLLYYIRAEKLFNDILEYANLSSNDRTTSENINFFVNAMKEFEN